MDDPLFQIQVGLIALAVLGVFAYLDLRSLITKSLFKENQIMSDLTQLTADVAADTSVDQSAIVLLQGLKAALDSAGTDPVALAALSTQLEANAVALAAAVTANTPAAPPATANVKK